MKTPEKNPKAEASKQKKQYIVLGGLLAVLAAVLAIQFGGSDGSAPRQASAMTAPAGEAPAESVSVIENTAPPLPVVKDNPVLSQPAVETAFARSPFSNFWNTSAPEGAAAAAIQIPAPTITLNATMPAESAGLAVIDGELRFVGDSIQGWVLSEVRPRAVTLRASTGDAVVVEMPLIVGRLSLPEPSAPGLPAGR